MKTNALREKALAPATVMLLILHRSRVAHDIVHLRQS